MKKKTIIAIYGRQNEGKSTTIRMIYNALIRTGIGGVPDREVPEHGDILVIVQVGDIRIAIESQGDPHGRMEEEDTLRPFSQAGCEIIICATRTRGTAVHMVDNIANEFGYHTLWTSTYFAPNFDVNLLNRRRAEDILRVIDDLILGRGRII